jgi:hypothetical protein
MSQAKLLLLRFSCLRIFQWKIRTLGLQQFYSALIDNSKVERRKMYFHFLLSIQYVKLR